MTVLEAVLVLLAGVWAGGINTVVGSGTLITFPVLLAMGVPPVSANVSNTIGLVPGSVSGAVGYRRELTGQRGRLLFFSVASTLGAVVGAVLLLLLPDGAFSAIVPGLIVLGLLSVVLQPRISRWTVARAERTGTVVGRNGPWWVWPAILATGVYGGYFGAAQGVLLVAIMGIGLDETLQRVNAAKNVLAAVTNGVAGVLFAVVADVDWLVVLLIGVGSVIGAQVGALVGRRLSPVALRITIVVVGTAALVVFLLR